jgi:hypothetical protein
MAHETNRRDSDHLIRLILNRNADLPNFTLLLGSGASGTSNVVTATDMIEVWRQQLYDSARAGVGLIDWLKRQDWFESDDEYSRPAPRRWSSQEVRIGLGARSRVHCSNSVGDTLPREL